MPLSLLSQLPGIIKTVKREHQFVDELIAKEEIAGLISDNRFGVHSTKIPTVYITHQLRVFSGVTTGITTWLHRKVIAKYDECWIPDTDIRNNLSGRLGHSKNSKNNWKHIGTLSRFSRRHVKKKYDLTAILSGPEPQRSILESILFKELKAYYGKVLLIRGTSKPIQNATRTMKVENFMTGKKLEQALLESEVIIARSGYSTIMDLATLQMKAFFIPTPGQPEQHYLAKRMQQLGIAPYCKQKNFDLDKLAELKNYIGFKNFETGRQAPSFLELFKGKGEG